MSDQKSLYTIVSNALEDAKNGGKTPIGYTVRLYQGVLSALQHATVVYNQVGGGVTGTNESQSIATRKYTKLAKLGLGGYQDQNGFIQYKDGTISYQAHCTLKDYMTFIVECPSSTAGKKGRSYVAVNRPSQGTQGTTGVVLQQGGNNPSFPPAKLDSEIVSTMQRALGGGQNTCVVGVGVSISDMAHKFFNKFYGDVKWTAAQLENIASQGYLYAQVILPFSKKSGYALHSRVTMKHEIQGMTKGPFQVWIPIPIMLLNDFNSLGSIMVKTDNSSQVQVNNSDITFPLSSSRYDHSNASIDGFTPNFIKGYVDDKHQYPIHYVSATLCNSGVQTRGRVRLYFLEEGKQYIQKQIGGQIPQQYLSNIFRGQANPNDYVVVEQIGGQVVFGGSIMEFWQSINQQLTNKIGADAIQRAVALVAGFESGQNWGMWKQCKRKDGTGDGQGISAGYLQFTQKAGGIKDYKDFYLQFRQKYTDAPQMSAAMQNAIDTYNEQNKPRQLQGFVTEFADQSTHQAGQLAQLHAWVGNKKTRGKKEKTVKWFNQFGCTTALQFAAIFGFANHVPSWVDDAFAKKRSSLSGKSAAQKAKILENTHWQTYVAHGKTLWPGHKERWKKILSLADSNETNLNSVVVKYPKKRN